MDNLRIIQEDESKPLIIRKIENIDRPVRLHFHQNYEISYILRGGYRYIVGDSLYPIEDHDLFVIDKNQVHTASSYRNTPMLRYSVKFLASEVVPFFDHTDLLAVFRHAGRHNSARIPIPPQDRAWFIRQFQKLLHREGYAWDVRRKLHLCELLIRINEIARTNDGPDRDQILERETGGTIKKLLQFIHQHLSEPLTLDLLARESATSKYHLTRKFKSELGISIYQYILTRRIGEAVRLLEEGQSIAEISDLTGFGSYGNFITAFRKIKGMSPHRFRKKVLQK